MTKSHHHHRPNTSKNPTKNKHLSSLKQRHFQRHKSFTYPNESLLFSSLDPAIIQQQKLEDERYLRERRVQRERHQRMRVGVYARDENATNEDLDDLEMQAQHEQLNQQELQNRIDRIRRGEKVSDMEKSQTVSQQQQDKYLQRRYKLEQEASKYRPTSNRASKKYNIVDQILFQRATDTIQARYDLDFDIDRKKLEKLNLSRELQNTHGSSNMSESVNLNFKHFAKAFQSVPVMSSPFVVKYQKFNHAVSRRQNLEEVREIQESLLDWRTRQLTRMSRKKRLQGGALSQLVTKKEGDDSSQDALSFLKPSVAQVKAMHKVFREHAQSLCIQSESQENVISLIFSLTGAHILIESHENASYVGLMGFIVHSTAHGCYLASICDDDTEMRYITWNSKMLFRVMMPAADDESGAPKSSGKKKGKKRQQHSDVSCGRREKHWIVRGDWILKYWQVLREQAKQLRKAT